jgi:hypothetical protein
LSTDGPKATSLFCNVAKATTAASGISDGGRRGKLEIKRQDDPVNLSRETGEKIVK